MKKPPDAVRTWREVLHCLPTVVHMTLQEMHEMAEYRCALLASEFAVQVEPRQQRRLEFARWLAQTGRINEQGA